MKRFHTQNSNLFIFFYKKFLHTEKHLRAKTSEQNKNKRTKNNKQRQTNKTKAN